MKNLKEKLWKHSHLPLQQKEKEKKKKKPQETLAGFIGKYLPLYDANP